MTFFFNQMQKMSQYFPSEMSGTVIERFLNSENYLDKDAVCLDSRKVFQKSLTWSSGKISPMIVSLEL